MSRSGYSDDGWDGDGPDTSGLYRASLHRSLQGKRGQQFLREALVALDAMPGRELAAESLVTELGDYCTLGVVGAARGIDLLKLDPEDPWEVAKAFGISTSVAREIVYQNDEVGDDWVEIPWVKRSHWDHIPTVRKYETPAERWQRMRAWISEQIVEAKP